MRPLILILMFLPLTACSLFESKELRTLRRSPDYRAGYQDGCSSAWGADKRRDDTIVRDDTQYQKNRAYRIGWNRGLNTCRSTGYTGGALPGTGNSGPFPDMNPGNGGRPRGL